MEYSPSLTRRTRQPPSFPFTRLAFIGFLFALLTRAGGQEIGGDICSCDPSTYEFTFDFALTCPPINVTQGGAIETTSCLVSRLGGAATDLVPVAVQSIDILELDQGLSVLAQLTITGNFGDGDSFTYVSIAASPGSITNRTVDTPRAIQLNIVGVNILDEPIISVYIIVFTNDCSAFPVLVNGQSAGWTVFSDLGNARQEYCPLAPPPVDPSPSPTLSPA
eukprot:scaffold330459_cov33-Attheya_sp.AAC.1